MVNNYNPNQKYFVAFFGGHDDLRSVDEIFRASDKQEVKDSIAASMKLGKACKWHGYKDYQIIELEWDNVHLMIGILTHMAIDVDKVKELVTL